MQVFEMRSESERVHFERKIANRKNVILHEFSIAGEKYYSSNDSNLLISEDDAKSKYNNFENIRKIVKN